jgi:orotidine-5'-phosphate decarboxylase
VASPLQRQLADRLIVGLDLPDAAAAERMVERLPDVTFYKIGLGMLATGGLDLAVRLRDRGLRVFLDLKLFDIPATVEAATLAIARDGPDLLTVHGDPHVVRAAVAGRDRAATVAGRDRAATVAGPDGARRTTRILAVTLLTSLDRADLDAAMIVPGDLAALAVERAARAFAAGADGVIASPREAAAIRALPEARGRLVVTPGVRPAGSPAHDQKRTATPAEAIAAGADHVVVARPIVAAADPADAARAILDELA